MKSPGRALEMGAKNGSAAMSKKPKAVLSKILYLINFIKTGKVLHFGKLVKVQI